MTDPASICHVPPLLHRFSSQSVITAQQFVKSVQPTLKDKAITIIVCLSTFILAIYHAIAQVVTCFSTCVTSVSITTQTHVSGNTGTILTGWIADNYRVKNKVTIIGFTKNLLVCKKVRLLSTLIETSTMKTTILTWLGHVNNHIILNIVDSCC